MGQNRKETISKRPVKNPNTSIYTDNLSHRQTDRVVQRATYTNIIMTQRRVGMPSLPYMSRREP